MIYLSLGLEQGQSIPWTREQLLDHKKALANGYSYKQNAAGAYASAPADETFAESEYVKAEQAKAETDKPDVFMWSPREFLNRPDPTPHVVDVVMLMELVNVYGGEKLGKSFLVMELLLCIATGMPFLGKYHVRRKGPVAYLTAEGSNSVKRRFLAWCGAHGVDPLTVPFYFKADYPRARKIVEAQTYIDGILARLKSDGHTTLVAAAIDTLTSSLEGEDENSSAAVGAFWLMAKTILKALDITLMVVGHTGKDESKGQRGWSGSGGTIDRAILVDGGDPARKAKVLRMSHALAKDTDDPPTNYIRLAQQSVPGQPGVYSRVCIPITEKEYKDAIAKGAQGLPRTALIRLKPSITARPFQLASQG